MDPVLPDYGGACIDSLVPVLLEGGPAPAWLPEPVLGADQLVLLVLDGLGWEQLKERPALAPTLHGMVGGPITTVVP
ncbi:MAG TPA: PglZ domain-containing protein, partial [Acidimicrobiales bacterium]|nr:PglZ domain-containing protein [Acidimicrobiales bacterium]